MQSLADSEGPCSDLSGKAPPADKSIRRAESLRRDSPLEPILLARQALQVRCACVYMCVSANIHCQSRAGSWPGRSAVFSARFPQASHKRWIYSGYPTVLPGRPCICSATWIYGHPWNAVLQGHLQCQICRLGRCTVCLYATRP